MTTDRPASPATGRQLPRWHARPRRGWLNDPNGFTRYGGRWHLFFQHNPAGAYHDQIHWGHLSSPDLVDWTEHPVAFGPQPGGPDHQGCWSGSFASGLDAPAVVYTGIAAGALQSTVCLRFGSEDLVTWGDPVVVAEQPSSDGIREMRDPFLFEVDGHPWAILGAGLEDGSGAVLLFDRSDMMSWTYAGVLCSAGDAGMERVGPATVWECPALIWVDGMPVLVISLLDGRDFGPALALVGSLREDSCGRPRFAAGAVQRLDAGPLLYAPQPVQVGDRALLIGWIREEEHREDLDAVSGCLSFPRWLSLKDGTVRSEPVAPCGPGQASIAGEQWPRSGEHRLPEAARIDLGHGPAGARLRRGESELLLEGEATIWVDGDVVEVYPPRGIPHTDRLRGTSWWLQLQAGVSATVWASDRPAPC